MPLQDSFKRSYQPFLECGRQALGYEAWENALRDGRLLDLDEAIRLAQEI